MTRRLRVGQACFVLAAAVAANASAEQTTPSADPAQTQDSQAADPSAKTPASKKKTDAPTESQQLDTITVTTGTRTAKAVDKIPGAITVITPAEIAHTLNLTEDATAVLARTVPGYAESSQALSNTGETLRGRIALRLFDGIPQGSPLREGGRSATFTDMGIVGRIEVINGPSASEGIGAAGGIINYISKTPDKEGNEVTILGRFGTEFHDDSAGHKFGINFARKSGDYDLLVAGSVIDRGISYDGHGYRIGPNTSGSVADSEATNLFAKMGYNFGAGDSQRLQLTVSHFKITGNGDYILVDGDRNTGRPNTAERGHIFGSKAEFNDFKQYSLEYNNADLYGGSLNLNAYYADQAMRYPPENGDDRQDPLIAPLGTLYDQSEIQSNKKGLRTSWTRPNVLGINGLEFRTGVDITRDRADQRLALTDRLWVPPLNYSSVAPYVQLSWDIGDATISAGFRHEDGEMHVDTYTTTYYRHRVQVTGGTLDYKANLPNIGIVYRLPGDWSVFASYGKGFSLPNVGIPLRNVNYPGQSVQGIVDLQAVIADNREVGANWRGERGSIGGSVYESKSKFGTSLSIDPITNDFILNRAPINIRGIELSGDFDVVDDVRVGALYSRILGKTTFVSGGPLDRQMGVLDINPDKIGTWVKWKFMPKADVQLGSTTLLSRDLNVGTSAEEHTHGYTLYDLTGNYETDNIGKFSVGVENLTNKFYILSWSQVIGFRNYWSGRGRVVSLNYSYTF